MLCCDLKDYNLRRGGDTSAEAAFSGCHQSTWNLGHRQFSVRWLVNRELFGVLGKLLPGQRGRRNSEYPQSEQVCLRQNPLCIVKGSIRCVLSHLQCYTWKSPDDFYKLGEIAALVNTAVRSKADLGISLTLWWDLCSLTKSLVWGLEGAAS